MMTAKLFANDLFVLWQTPDLETQVIKSADLKKLQPTFIAQHLFTQIYINRSEVQNT